MTIEPVCFIIRIGKNHNRLGDPYETSATAIKQIDGSIEIAGLNGEFSISVFKELKRLLPLYNIYVAKWKRIKDGIITHHEYKVTK